MNEKAICVKVTFAFKIIIIDFNPRFNQFCTPPDRGIILNKNCSFSGNLIQWKAICCHARVVWHQTPWLRGVLVKVRSKEWFYYTLYKTSKPFALHNLSLKKTILFLHLRSDHENWYNLSNLIFCSVYTNNSYIQVDVCIYINKLNVYLKN